VAAVYYFLENSLHSKIYGQSYSELSSFIAKNIDQKNWRPYTKYLKFYIFLNKKIKTINK
jgi:hypothetical protein